MSVASRLIGFAALLGAVFGLAVLAGGQAELGASAPSAGSHGREGHAAPVDEVRGLAVSQHGLTLKLTRTRVRADARESLRFRIVDARGRTVRDFDVEHARRMHLIVARRDLTGFQHLHPEQSADGSWSVAAHLPEGGAYRVFADFARNGKPRTLGADLSADGPSRTRPLPAPAAAAATDGFVVTQRPGAARAGREARLDFTVTRARRRMPIQPYLGARGHLVALREGDLAFLHVHPDADRLRFASRFPSAGRYRLFLQFKTAGRVHTAAFTREVGR